MAFGLTRFFAQIHYIPASGFWGNWHLSEVLLIVAEVHRKKHLIRDQIYKYSSQSIIHEKVIWVTKWREHENHILTQSDKRNIWNTFFAFTELSNPKRNIHFT